MMSRKTLLLIVVSKCMLACGFQTMGQAVEKVPYYVNLNVAEPGIIHDVSDLRLYLEYNDMYGKSKEFLFKIYDWRREVVASLRMDKSLGMNNYSIKLDEVYSGWESNKVYTGEVKNEAGTLYKLPIRIVPLPETAPPVVSIMVNPLQIGCQDLSSSLVEFYGEISGGKAPYTVNWYVLNNARTDFLYQPKQEIIALAGKTALIRVDKNPDYYVVLYVKDACGKEQKQIVNLVCSNEMKKINTIFVEELNSTLFKEKKVIK
jgi:hypothetical protein